MVIHSFVRISKIRSCYNSDVGFTIIKIINMMKSLFKKEYLFYVFLGLLGVSLAVSAVNASTTISGTDITGGGNITVPAEYGLDVVGTGALNIGTTTATSINIGVSGRTTAILGNATVAGTLQVTGVSTFSSNLKLLGGYSLDTTNAGGALNIGTTSATSVIIGSATAKVGIATSSPFASLSVQGVAGTIPFAVSSSTVAGAMMPVFEVNNNGHIIVSGAAPSVSTCGAGSPSVSGNDTAGKVTTGSSAATSCTVTFANTYTSAPVCILTGGPASGSTLYSPLFSSTTATTFSFMATSTTAGTSPSMNSWVISYLCVGVQ